MTEALQKAVENITPHRIPTGLAALGLGQPGVRFIVGSALGMVLVWAIRPGVSFDEGGQPRQFTLFAAPDEDSTALPWYLLAFLPGIIFSVFI